MLGNFLGGVWLTYENSLVHYLTSMLVLSLVGVVMFMALPSVENGPGSPKQTPTESIAEKPEIEPPRRANTMCSNNGAHYAINFENEELLAEGDEQAVAVRQSYCQVYSHIKTSALCSK